MRIGLDFDNTIICYDKVFCNQALKAGLVPADFAGSKSEVKQYLQDLPEGDLIWQRLQGKVYGEFLREAEPFPDLELFLQACAHQGVELFIVSHKTLYGHFDEKKINLRDAALGWLKDQQILNYFVKRENIFFEMTREEKIARIKTLQCQYFIDDLIEVFNEGQFAASMQGILFQPYATVALPNNVFCFTNWNDIKHAIFSNAS